MPRAITEDSAGANAENRGTEVQSLCDRALASELVPFEAREKLPGRSRIPDLNSDEDLQSPAGHEDDLPGTGPGRRPWKSHNGAFFAEHQTFRGRQQLGFYKMVAGELEMHVEVSKDRLH